MKKIFSFLIITVSLCMLTSLTIAQDSPDRDFYLVIEDTGALFTDNDSLMVIDKFFIHNFPDEKSSKEMQQKINAVKNVYSFGIASRAEKISNQRRCYLKLEKNNYLKTFKKVLSEMEIDHILLNNQKTDINSFIKKLK